ncbi:hypothetical protein ACWDUD_24485 [Rhodococcus sp. NPDC003382]
MTTPPERPRSDDLNNVQCRQEQHVTGGDLRVLEGGKGRANRAAIRVEDEVRHACSVTPSLVLDTGWQVIAREDGHRIESARQCPGGAQYRGAATRTTAWFDLIIAPAGRGSDECVSELTGMSRLSWCRLGPVVASAGWQRGVT